MARALSKDPRPQSSHARIRLLHEAWAGAVVFAGLLTLAATVSPEQPGHYPTCPFRALTGFACPGCGSLRALHDLAFGDLATALTHNAMLVGVLPIAMVAWVRVVTGRARDRSAPRWLGWAILGALAVWTVLRNLPVARGVLTAP
jgi:hypothetical protein